MRRAYLGGFQQVSTHCTVSKDLLLTKK